MAQRASFFTVRLNDAPGALLTLLQDFKARNISLTGLWGYRGTPGEAEIHFVAKNPDKLRDALRASGRTFEEGTGFFQKGTDKTGALVKSLEAIALARIDITGIHAIAVGGNYGSYIRVAPPDVERTASALGVK